MVNHLPSARWSRSAYSHLSRLSSTLAHAFCLIGWRPPKAAALLFATFHFLALPLSSCFQCPRPSLRLTSDLFIEELG